MDIYLSAKTDVDDVIIDYIEVRLKTGEVVSLNWDTIGIQRYKNGFDAECCGVYFGEESAAGRISELYDAKIVCVGLYSESHKQGGKVRIVEIHVDDNFKQYVFGFLPFTCELETEAS